MSNQTPLQGIVIAQETMTKASTPMFLALFNADGTPWEALEGPAGEQGEQGEPGLLSTPAAFQADTVAADLTALKVDFNLLLDKLQTAGLMESS